MFGNLELLTTDPFVTQTDRGGVPAVSRRRRLRVLQPEAEDAAKGNVPLSAGWATATWRTAQILSLAALGLLLPALWLVPNLALKVLWSAIVPLLPATFLVHPGLWRNVCPVATLNMVVGRDAGGRKLSATSSMRIGAVGIALFIVLVPARHLLFNLSGPAVAAVIVLFGTLALTSGRLFDRKAGFCNAICPMLAVERLYGQAPLVDVPNPRCDGCSLCTARGCIDLAKRKSIPQILGRARHSSAWLGRSFGVFAATLPGFSLGYFLAPDRPLSAAGEVYMTVAGCAGVTYVLTLVISVAFRAPARATIIGLAASAALLFYWFVAVDVSRAWGWGPAATAVIRLGAAALVGFWVWRIVGRR